MSNPIRENSYSRQGNHPPPPAPAGGIEEGLWLLLMTAKPPAEESAYTRGCQKQTGRRWNIADDKTDRGEAHKFAPQAEFRDRIIRHFSSRVFANYREY